MLTVDPQWTFRRFVDLIVLLLKPREPTSNPSLPLVLTTLLQVALQPKVSLPDRLLTSAAILDGKAQTHPTLEDLVALVALTKTLTTLTHQLLLLLPRPLEDLQ
jgi:hypothetical protein